MTREFAAVVAVASLSGVGCGASPAHLFSLCRNRRNAAQLLGPLGRHKEW